MEKSTKIKWCRGILEDTFKLGQEISKADFEKTVKTVTGRFEHLTYTETKDLREYINSLGDCMTCTRGKYPRYKYTKSKEDCLKRIETINSERVGVKRTVSSTKLDIFNTLNFLYKIKDSKVLYETLREGGYTPSESWAKAIVEKAEVFGAHINICTEHTGMDIYEHGKKRHLTKWVIMKVSSQDEFKRALFILGESLKADGIAVEYPIFKEESDSEVDVYQKRIETQMSSLGYITDEKLRRVTARAIVNGEYRDSSKEIPVIPEEIEEVEEKKSKTIMLFVSLDEAAKLEGIFDDSDYEVWVGEKSVLARLSLSADNIVKASPILAGKELVDLVPTNDSEVTKALSAAVIRLQKINELAERKKQLLQEKEEIEFKLLELEEEEETLAIM